MSLMSFYGSLNTYAFISSGSLCIKIFLGKKQDCKAFGWYPNSGPVLTRFLHHSMICSSLPLVVASSENHTCNTKDKTLSLSVRGSIVVIAYIPIASGSPSENDVPHHWQRAVKLHVQKVLTITGTLVGHFCTIGQLFNYFDWMRLGCQQVVLH